MMQHGGTEFTARRACDFIVIPAKAGIQERPGSARGPFVQATGTLWTPAFAGVTKGEQLSQGLVIQVAPGCIGLLDQREFPSSVFPDTTAQVAGHSDVKRPVSPVGKNVNTRLHAPIMIPWRP